MNSWRASKREPTTEKYSARKTTKNSPVNSWSNRDCKTKEEDNNNGTSTTKTTNGQTNSWTTPIALNSRNEVLNTLSKRTIRISSTRIRLKKASTSSRPVFCPKRFSPSKLRASNTRTRRKHGSTSA